MPSLAILNRGAVCVLAAVLLLAACGGRETPPAQQQAPPATAAQQGEPEMPPLESVYAQWLESATADNPDIATMTVLAGLLGQYENGYEKMYGLLQDAEVDPKLKLMATISMQTYVFPEDTERLVALTQPEHDPTTRACAAQLLSSIPEPATQARARLAELMHDSALQVRAAAVLALAMRGDGDATAALIPLWEEEGLTKHQRANILYALPDAGPGQYRDLYLEAVQMGDLPADLRIALVEQLSLLSDPGVRETLAAIGENDDDLDVRIMAQGAAAAMSTRLEAPLETGSGE